MDEENMEAVEGSFMDVDYKFKFNAIRLIDFELIPSVFDITVGIDIIEPEMMSRAMEKINYWIDHFLDNVLISSAEETSPETILDEDGSLRFSNICMITPDIPTDNHLCVLLQSKLEALANDAFKITVTKLSSNNSQGLTFSHYGNSNISLPTMEEWISGNPWFDVPWWNRDDSSTIDTNAPPDRKKGDTPSWAVDIGAVLDSQNKSNEAIILTGTFEPKIVEE